MNSGDNQGQTAAEATSDASFLAELPPAAVRRPLTADEAIGASRHHWDTDAQDYLDEHRAVLGDQSLLWGPEGVREADAGLLGPVAGLRVLELGCGAGQGGRWLRAEGALAVGVDISLGMLQAGQRLDRDTATTLPTVQGAAERLPFASGSFDLVVSAFGALPFVADLDGALTEITRVLVPGGRLVASVLHPLRWVFPDDPAPESLTVTTSYFDRTPYVEQDANGRAEYAEHHRTMSDWVRALRRAGLTLDDLAELEWAEGSHQTWGAWSPERGALIPGTMVIAASRT